MDLPAEFAVLSLVLLWEYEPVNYLVQSKADMENIFS